MFRYVHKPETKGIQLSESCVKAELYERALLVRERGEGKLPHGAYQLELLAVYYRVVADLLFEHELGKYLLGLQFSLVEGIVFFGQIVLKLAQESLERVVLAPVQIGIVLLGVYPVFGVVLLGNAQDYRGAGYEGAGAANLRVERRVSFMRE